MPPKGCLKLMNELKAPYDPCLTCKKYYPKWHDKPRMFYSADGEPQPNCIHFCTKYRTKFKT